MGKPCHLYQLFGSFIMENLHGMGFPCIFLSLSVFWNYRKIILPGYTPPRFWYSLLELQLWPLIISLLFFPLLPVSPHSYFLPATSVLCCFSVTPGQEQIPPSAYLSSGRKCTHTVTPDGSLLTISETWYFLPGLFYSHIHPLLPIAPGAFQICHGSTWLQNLPKPK